jgi:hypothetical protein
VLFQFRTHVVHQKQYINKTGEYRDEKWIIKLRINTTLIEQSISCDSHLWKVQLHYKWI